MTSEVKNPSAGSLADAIHFSSNDCWDVNALLRAIDAISGDVQALGGLEADALADSIHRLARMAQSEVARIANDLDLVNLSMRGEPDSAPVGPGSGNA